MVLQDCVRREVEALEEHLHKRSVDDPVKVADPVLDVVVFVVALVEDGLPWQEHVLLQQLNVQLLVLSGDICHWQVLDLFREVLLEAVSEVGHSVFDHVLEPQINEIRIAFTDFDFDFDL